MDTQTIILQLQAMRQSLVAMAMQIDVFMSVLANTEADDAQAPNRIETMGQYDE